MEHLHSSTQSDHLTLWSDFPLLCWQYQLSVHCTYHPAESPSSTASLKQKPGSALTCANWTVKSKNSWLWCPRAGFGWGAILSSMEGCPNCHSSEIFSLELILVSTCSCDFHIKSAVWSTFLHLKSMSYYCNGVLFGPPNKALGRIQDVQNPVASRSLPTWNICTSFRSSPWCAANQQNGLSGIGPSVWLTCWSRLGDTSLLVVCLLRKVSLFSFIKLLFHIYLLLSWCYCY